MANDDTSYKIEFTTLRGRLKGQKLIVHQICNDWLTAKFPDGSYANDGQPIALRNVYIDYPADRAAILNMEMQKKLGQMFRIYFSLNVFLDTGRFKRPKVV